MGVAQNLGLLREGDLVVQTQGTLENVSGSTDLVRVGMVSAVLGRGIGIGSGSVNGKVRVATSPEEAAGLQSGEILVVPETNAAYLETIRRCKGLITEAEGAQSHAAVIAERLGIPAIVGVSQATTSLLQGEIITLSVQEGIVHRGALSPIELRGSGGL
jgi:pyruvate kinase